MTDSERTVAYESWLANLRLAEVVERMREHGVDELWVKRLSDNQDNTKNQIYLGGDIGDIPLPMGSFEASQTASGKDARRSTKYIAPLDFHWLTPDGSNPVNAAKVIFYPQYPEVRFSGFIRGATDAPRRLLDRSTQLKGRVLVFGSFGLRTYGVLLPPSAPAAQELHVAFDAPERKMIGPLLHVPLETSGLLIAEDTILAELHAVWLKSPIPGCRVDKSGEVIPFTDRPAGGATLETVLGVRANSDSAPDFHGWELKSFSGREITLMTPAPTAGFIKDEGFEAFMRSFGYWNHEKSRFDFTGRHRIGCDPGGRATTRLVMVGFDDGIRDADGYLAVVDRQEREGGRWTFSDLLDHWRKKHANAVYVPNKRQDDSFTFGPLVSVAVGADFKTFMARLADGTIAFDPGCHFRPAAENVRTDRHARYQWRVTYSRIGSLYDDVRERDVRHVPPDDSISTADCRRQGLLLPVPALAGLESN